MKPHLLLTVVIVFLFSAITTACAPKPTLPPGAGPTGPAQAAPGAAGTMEPDALIDGMYYRYGRPITEGWNGLAWGSSVSQLQDRFPKAKRRQSGPSRFATEKKRQPGQDVWMAGSDKETFFGVTAPVSYHFDQQGRFIAVSFTPTDSKQIETMITAMVQRFGPPKGDWPVWNFDKVTILVVNRTVVIRGNPHKWYVRWNGGESPVVDQGNSV